MKPVYYYTSTLALFILEATIASFVPSVDKVFDFLAAVAVSMLGFGFPSIFYIYAEKKFGDVRDNSGNKKFMRCMAYFHGFLAVLVFILCFSEAIINLVTE